MEDFNEYAKKEQPNPPQGLADMINNIAKNFDGKSQNELLMAIYKEAQKGKRNGTLTNEEIDNFARIIAPMLDEKKLKILNKLIKELKKI